MWSERGHYTTAAARSVPPPKTPEPWQPRSQHFQALTPSTSEHPHPRNQHNCSCTLCCWVPVTQCCTNGDRQVLGNNKCRQVASISLQSTWLWQDLISKNNYLLGTVTVLNCQRDYPSTRPLDKTLGWFHRLERSRFCLLSCPLTPHSTQEGSDRLGRLCTICSMETQISSQLLNGSKGLSSALWQRSNTL